MSFFDCAGSKRRPYKVLTEVLDGKQIPVLNGFDCSHTHPMLTLPLGVKLVIDFDNKNISIAEQYLPKKNK